MGPCTITQRELPSCHHHPPASRFFTSIESPCLGNCTHGDSITTCAHLLALVRSDHPVAALVHAAWWYLEHRQLTNIMVGTCDHTSLRCRVCAGGGATVWSHPLLLSSGRSQRHQPPPGKLHAAHVDGFGGLVPIRGSDLCGWRRILGRARDPRPEWQPRARNGVSTHF